MDLELLRTTFTEVTTTCGLNPVCWFVAMMMAVVCLGMYVIAFVWVVVIPIGGILAGINWLYERLSGNRISITKEPDADAG